eukprot:scaffold433469_cov30-Prasinocladus_malaysianus.AAC.1
MAAARLATPTSGSRPQSAKPGSSARRLSVTQPEPEPFHVSDFQADGQFTLRPVTRGVFWGLCGRKALCLS